jgi:hypothetical protein
MVYWQRHGGRIATGPLLPFPSQERLARLGRFGTAVHSEVVIWQHEPLELRLDPVDRSLRASWIRTQVAPLLAALGALRVATSYHEVSQPVASLVETGVTKAGLGSIKGPDQAVVGGSAHVSTSSNSLEVRWACV